MTMQQPALVQFLQQLVDIEIKPSFKPPAELPVDSYSQDIFRRFQNPAVRHLLAQIAWDGSQKLPMRLLPIIQDNLAAVSLAIEDALYCHWPPGAVLSGCGPASSQRSLWSIRWPAAYWRWPRNAAMMQQQTSRCF